MMTDHIGAHLGDPCIHCGIAHDLVESGPCLKANGLAAHHRNAAYYGKLLVEVNDTFQKESLRLKICIAAANALALMMADGLDTEIVSLAESVMYASDLSKAGEDGASVIRDAIKWFAGENVGYRGLKEEFFGTKNYDRWRGQRCDCTYGCGPGHGSICFSIGLLREACNRDLTDAEKDACIYYLMNLKKIQDARKSAKAVPHD